MTMLTDEQIEAIYKQETGALIDDSPWALVDFSRAIEAAVTEPLLQRIAELEKALKLVQQHHATAWNRGHIAGMAANRMVAQDALNAVKKDAWNNTQLTEALMAAEGRCEELEQRNRDLYEDVQRFKKHAMNEKAARMELERQLEEARKQMEAQKDEWLSWEAKRKALEKEAESYRQLRNGSNWPAVFASHDAPEPLRGEELDAAMQKGQS